MSIACLMIAGGTMVALRDSPERPIWPSRYTCFAALVGGGLALYAFMAEAVHLASQEVKVLMELRPERFDWPLFLLGLVGLTTPVAELAWRARTTGCINEVSCLDADGR